MKLHRLELHNYRRFQDATIEFPDGVLAVVGANGSGKSSLLEALGFALFGTQATRTAKAQLRHSNAPPGDAVEVTAQIELAGQAIEVKRSFRGANLTAHASLTIDGKPLVSGGANSHGAVTAEMERLLGMDRTAFFTSVVAQQKELSRLTDLAANDRKQLILKMLGIDAVDHAIDEARAMRRSAQQRADDLQEAMPLDDLAAALKQAEAAASDAASAVTAADTAWQAAKQDLERGQQAMDAARQSAHERDATARQLAEAKRDLNQAKLESVRIQAELQHASAAAAAAAQLADQAAQLPARQQALDAARRQADRARQQVLDQEALDKLSAKAAQLESPDPGDGATFAARIAAAQALLSTTREQMAGLAARLEQVKEHAAAVAGADAHAPCPFCLQPIEEQLPQLHESLAKQETELAQKKSALGKQARQASEALAAIQAEQQSWQSAKQAFDASVAERNHIEAAMTQLKQRIGTPIVAPDISALERQVSAAQEAERERIRLLAQSEDAATLERQRDAILARVSACTQTVSAAEACLAKLPMVDLEPISAALDKATTAERNCERAVLAANTQCELAQQQVEHVRTRLEERAKQQAALKQARHDLRVWTALAGGRNTGLLEQFRSHLVGKIRPAINHEASRLLDRFTDGRYRELILDEDYGVFVVDEGVPYALDRFSGGESDLAHLALRLAVSRLLTRRSGAPELRFLALDEVFGSLDRQRRDAVLAALHGLEDLYSQVVLVTHQEDLREVLDAVLEVRAEGDGSVVHLHHG